MSKRIQKQHDDVEVSSGASRMPAAETFAAFARAGQTGTWLRPAAVVAVAADSLTVDAGDRGTVTARMAMPIPYAAAIGDELLVLGEGEHAYVVGVLRGAGTMRLELEGDVEISATGKLGLRAGASVTIDAPEVQVRSGRMSMLAGRVTQAFDSVRTTVRELLLVRAGEQQTFVDGTSHLQAKNARMLSESKVTINGKEIFLG
jgi:hypothetical protein